MVDELPPDLLAKYKAEDELARQRIAEGKSFIDNGWDSDLDRGGHTFGQAGFGDSLSSNCYFGRRGFPSRRYRRSNRSNNNNNFSRTRTNPNWKRNPVCFYIFVTQLFETNFEHYIHCFSAVQY